MISGNGKPNRCPNCQARKKYITKFLDKMFHCVRCHHCWKI